MSERIPAAKSAEAYRTISEVADELKLPQHVLRFWETRFPQIRPLKRAGGRRFYRPEDVALLSAIKALLYGEGYTIKGVQRMLQEHGPRGVAAVLVAGKASPARMSPSVAPRDGRLAAGADTRLIPEPAAAEMPNLPVPVPVPAPPIASPPPAPRPARSPHVARDAPDLVARLEAVAFDLSECERLLGSVSRPRNGD